MCDTAEVSTFSYDSLMCVAWTADIDKLFPCEEKQPSDLTVVKTSEQSLILRLMFIP